MLRRRHGRPLVLLVLLLLAAALAVCRCGTAVDNVGDVGNSGDAPGDAPGNSPSPRLSEAAGWLRGYVQIDTTNPPGNERRAAEYLAAILARQGIPSRLWVSPTGRVNLSARLTSRRR